MIFIVKRFFCAVAAECPIIVANNKYFFVLWTFFKSAGNLSLSAKLFMGLTSIILLEDTVHY